MEQIYKSAIDILNKRVSQCGTAIQCSLDAYSVSYWQLELAKANHLKMRIGKRFKVNHNVIHVNFQSKRRVA